MWSYFESLPVKTQFIVLAIGLVLLFLLVRWNSKNNRHKRLKRQNENFAERLHKRRKEREEENIE